MATTEPEKDNKAHSNANPALGEASPSASPHAPIVSSTLLRRNLNAPKPLRAIVDYQDGLDAKSALPYATAIANEQLKLPELCNLDVIRFKNDVTDGYLVEVHQAGSKRSHLKAIHALCEQNDGSIGFFEIAGQRIIQVQVTEGKPDALLLNEQKSRAILRMSEDQLAKEGLIRLPSERLMKPVIRANMHLIWIGAAFLVVGLCSLAISGSYYQSQFNAARHVRALSADNLPHLQWNRVARPAPGRYVTRLQFESGQWSQETQPFAPSTNIDTSTPGPLLPQPQENQQ